MPERLDMKAGRALALLIAVVAALAIAWPTAAWADVVAGGTGETGNWSWSLDADGTLTIGGTGIESDLASREALWHDNASSITAVSFKDGSTTGDCLVRLFGDCTNLERITWNGLNTSAATNMESMFYGCSNLKSVDLSGFTTANVTDMGGMFWGCSGLESVTFGEHFDTSGVTDMLAMFWGCSSLTSLDLSSFDTHNGQTNMDNMFHDCTSLASITLGEDFVWNTSGVNATLPQPKNDLTWVRVDGSGLPTAGDKGYTPEALAEAYPATAKPGTYVWNTFVTVAYNANGGSGQMTPKVLRKAEGATLASSAFERPGYEFVGWNTKADGTGTSFTDGAKLSASDLESSIGGTFMLYAQWKALPVDPEEPTDPTDPSEPTNPSDPTKPTTDPSDTDPSKTGPSTTPSGTIPQTGDAVSPMLPIALCAAGAVVIAAGVGLRRRTNS